MFTHCLGSFLLQNMLLSLHEFAFEGQNMNFTVNMLLTCILNCAPGPTLIRTVKNCSQLQYVVISRTITIPIPVTHPKIFFFFNLWQNHFFSFISCSNLIIYNFLAKYYIFVSFSCIFNLPMIPCGRGLYINDHFSESFISLVQVKSRNETS